jgi:hypothetical protein
MTNTKSFRLERYAGRLLPSSLIAGAMDRAMMDPTEGHGESIARLMAEISDSRLICKDSSHMARQPGKGCAGHANVAAILLQNWD